MAEEQPTWLMPSSLKQSKQKPQPSYVSKPSSQSIGGLIGEA